MNIRQNLALRGGGHHPHGTNDRRPDDRELRSDDGKLTVSGIETEREPRAGGKVLTVLSKPLHHRREAGLSPARELQRLTCSRFGRFSVKLGPVDNEAITGELVEPAVRVVGILSCGRRKLVEGARESYGVGGLLHQRCGFADVRRNHECPTLQPVRLEVAPGRFSPGGSEAGRSVKADRPCDRSPAERHVNSRGRERGKDSAGPVMKQPSRSIP